MCTTYINVIGFKWVAVCAAVCSSLRQFARQCALVRHDVQQCERQWLAVRATVYDSVCDSARGSVRQCAAVCDSVRKCAPVCAGVRHPVCAIQCAPVGAAVCGPAASEAV
jgi:hypothetical protein